MLTGVRRGAVYEGDQPVSPARISPIPIPRAYYGRTPVRSTVVTAINAAIVISAGPVAYAFGSPIAYVVAFLLVGARAQALYILQHECMHWLLYKSRRANNTVGTLLSGLLGTGLNFGRFVHFKHHSSVGSADDPNRIWHDSVIHAPGWSTFWFFAGQAFGVRLVWLVGRYVGLNAGRPPLAPETVLPSGQSGLMRTDLLVVVVIQATLLIGMTLASALWVYIVLFVLPLVTLTTLFEAVRSFAEHVLPGERAATPAAEARLFFMDAGPIERFFVSQFGFHYHHLHHLYPGVVTFKLSSVHNWLRENDPAYAAKYIRRAGYIRTAARYVLNRPLQPELSS